MAMLAVEKGPNKGAECKLPKEGEILLGRSSVCQLTIPDSKASRQHCRVEVRGEKVTVTDLDSHNGTYVNREKIALPTVLNLGDEILIGEVVIRLKEEEGDSLIGTELGGYRLEQRLGEGGMGDVYKATQISLGRTVAVKVLSEDLSKDQGFVGRFLEEARAAGRLNHPNIVHVHEVGQDKDRYFYAMEYVSGGNIGQLVEGGGTLEPKQAVKMILQAAKALEYAEKEGIVHCDVKPDNLMITSDGDVRLADLGIAKHTGELATSDDGEGVFGSPHYMSPEQSRGEAVDHRSDLYSLGCTLYRVLAGRPAFDGKTAREIMEKQVYEEATPIRKVNPATPGVLSVIISKLLEKKPGDRYQSASALIKDLEHAQEVIGEKAGPVGARVTGRQVRVRGAAGLTLTLIFGGAAAVAAVVAVVMLISHYGEPQELLNEAISLEKNGHDEGAVKAYERASRRGGSGPVGVKARKRLAALKERIDLEERTEEFKEDLSAVASKGYAGGEELAAGLNGLRQIESRKHLALEDYEAALQDLTRRLEEAALAELEQRKSDAQSLISRMEYGRAVELFEEFPECYARTPAAGGASGEIAAVKQRARDDLAAAMEKAEAMVEQVGTSPAAVADAIRLIAPFLKRTGFEDVSATAEASRRNLEKRAAAIQDEIEEKKRQARIEQANWQYDLSGMQAHLYRFADARKTARHAQVMLRQVGDNQKAAELEERVKTIQQLEILFDLLLSGLERNTIRNNKIKLPYKGEARLVGARRRSSEFILRLKGEDLLLPYGRVPPGEIVRIFKEMDLYADDHVPLAEFCMEFGFVEEALAEVYYFDRVRSAKERAAKVRKRVESRQIGLSDEKAAEVLAKVATRHAAAGRTDEARRSLGILRFRYGDTPSAGPTTIARIVKAMMAGRKKAGN